MKNHELLDIIGEVNEEYVQAADCDAARPRFRWKTWAACAACAALIAAAYPVFRTFQPQAAVSYPEVADEAVSPCEDPEASQGPGLVQRPGLHSYALIEESSQAMATYGEEVKVAPAAPAPVAPAVDVTASMPEQDNGSALPDGTYVGGDAAIDNMEGPDIPVQEGAYYYEQLMQGMGVSMDGSPAVYPEWFAGAWLDGDQGELLAVAVVRKDRTPELEAQIRGWAGGTVIFHNAKYSQNDLDGLMKEIDRVFEKLDCKVTLSYGVYVSDNSIHLDFFEMPSDEVLSALAELDPEGDAIFIQVFTGLRNVLTDEAAKGPAPEPVTEPVPGGARVEPSIDGQDFPGEISVGPDFKENAAPAYTENGQPALCGYPPREDICDLPQAKYDVIYGADE